MLSPQIRFSRSESENRGQAEAEHAEQENEGAGEIDPGVAPRRAGLADHQRSNQRAKTLHREDHADRKRRQAQHLLADHRHHGDVGKTPEIGDQRDHQHADDQPPCAHIAPARAQRGEDRALAAGPLGAVAGAQDQDDGQQVQERAQQVDAEEAQRLEQEAAQGRSQHTGRVVVHRIQGHRLAEPMGPGDLGAHDAAQRHVAGEEGAAHDRAERDLPERDLPGEGEGAQGDRSRADDRKADQQHPAALVAIAQRADQRAAKEHRRQAQRRDQRHQRGRAGLLEDVDADREQLEPAQRAGDRADQPHPAKIGVRQQRLHALSLGRLQLRRGIAIGRIGAPVAPRSLMQAPRNAYSYT
jgi:hypothetical protein